MARNQSAPQNNEVSAPAAPAAPVQFTGFAPKNVPVRAKSVGFLDKAQHLEPLIKQAMALTGLERDALGLEVTYAGLSYIGQMLQKDINYNEQTKEYEFIDALPSSEPEQMTLSDFLGDGE